MKSQLHKALILRLWSNSMFHSLLLKARICEKWCDAHLKCFFLDMRCGFTEAIPSVRARAYWLKRIARSAWKACFFSAVDYLLIICYFFLPMYKKNCKEQFSYFIIKNYHWNLILFQIIHFYKKVDNIKQK